MNTQTNHYLATHSASRASSLSASSLLFMCALVAAIGIQPARAFLPDIYPPTSQAQADIDAGLKEAAATHKRVILDFGGNWCPDCHALDGYFHDAANKPLLEANYVLVHVNIGHMDENVAIAERYEIPLKKGVPALAVLNAKGVLLFSQKTGEFEAMRDMQSSAVTEFLTRWKRP